MLSQNVRRFIPWIIILAAVLAAAGGYLYVSGRISGPGFPLDDAWIHLTYARNLGLYGEWAFIHGKPSAGSTAPLWTSLLALGFALHFPMPYTWTYMLGIFSLAGLAVAGEIFFRQETQTAAWLPWAGLFLAGEYHLVWASVSGMETLLIGLFYLLGLFWISRSRGRWELIGLLIGVGVWIRPDGITLIGPALFIIFLSTRSWRTRIFQTFRLLGGLAIFLLPYFIFNLQFRGSLWPNTFYAKQAEYAVLQQRPLVLRVLSELSLPLIGAGILLIPGFIYILYRAFEERRWGVLAAAIWFIGYTGIYAMNLPVTYQYGRYMIPAMPVYFVLGMCGLMLLYRTMVHSKAGRLFRFAYIFTVAGVWIGFYLIGAMNYARDVAIIETEMVATAKWIAANTAPGDLIAVHDIGAMGYFGKRDIVDLAGLVTPEVIPFIRDENRLADYLDQRGAAVLVTFPGWYANLIDNREVLYSSGGRYAQAAGGENLQVYRWR